MGLVKKNKNKKEQREIESRGVADISEAEPAHLEYGEPENDVAPAIRIAADGNAIVSLLDSRGPML